MTSENERRVERAKRQMQWAAGAVVTLVLLMALTFAVLMLPFTPMTVHTYALAQREACPGEAVEVVVEYELEPDVDVRDVQVRGYWIARDVSGVVRDQTVQGTEAHLPAESISPGFGKATMIRTAQPAPGEWEVGARVQVRGTMFSFVPYLQEIDLRAAKPLTVVPPDTEGCVQFDPGTPEEEN